MSDMHDMQFPRGQLAPDDEGRLEMRLQVRGDTLVIDFGKEIVWFGLGLADVQGLIRVLEKNVEIMKGRQS